MSERSYDPAKNSERSYALWLASATNHRAWAVDQLIRFITQRMTDGSADARDEKELQELLLERVRILEIKQVQRQIHNDLHANWPS